MWPHWINIVISFIAIFLGVRHNIKKDRYPKAMIIFLSLFVIEQILAYSIGIDVLKINRANEDIGYALPQNWAFDQIATITVGSGRGLITIDKNIASGLDAGQSSVEPINHKDDLDSTLILTYLPMIREEVPPIIKDILNFLQEFSSIREPIDSVNIVLDYDGLITRMARKLQMRKSFI